MSDPLPSTKGAKDPIGFSLFSFSTEDLLREHRFRNTLDKVSTRNRRKKAFSGKSRNNEANTAKAVPKLTKKRRAFALLSLKSKQTTQGKLTHHE